MHKALRRGWLIAEADGRIDLKREPNASYLAHHAGGYDIRVRPMSTHRGPGQQRQAEAPFNVGQFLDTFGDLQVDGRAADYVLSGLVGTNEEAIRAVAALLAGLPALLAELRASIAELRALGRQAGAAAKAP